MDADDREADLLEQARELAGTRDRLDEDDHLVELEVVDQVGQLAVLLLLLDVDVVLLEAVQRQLGLAVDEDLVRLAGVDEVAAAAAEAARGWGLAG